MTIIEKVLTFAAEFLRQMFFKTHSRINPQTYPTNRFLLVKETVMTAAENYRRLVWESHPKK